MHNKTRTKPMWRSIGFLAVICCLSACDGELSLPPITDMSVLDLGQRLDAESVDAGTGCVRREEICNGLDDDCDGQADEYDDVRAIVFSDPQNCGSCGHNCTAPNAQMGCNVGQCIVNQCDPGFVDYNGDASDGCEASCVLTSGGREVCDELDNDCDGVIDEDFDLTTDIENCGRCGERCPEVPQASKACVEGRCSVESCDPDWYDLNDSADDGCEYNCSIRSSDRIAEFCNGLDDDCDGRVDEAADLEVPENVCGVEGACAPECENDGDCPEAHRCNDGGICVGADDSVLHTECETDAECQARHPGYACTDRSVLEGGEWIESRRCVERTHAPICDGENGFRCARSPTWLFGNEAGACDGEDNDCDGRTDEDFVGALYLPDRQTPRPCTNGLGVCRRSGTARCALDGDGTVCSADPGLRENERDDECNGRDEDCDGSVDEGHADSWINLGDFEIFAYEASRPGATSIEPGIDSDLDDEFLDYVEARACSRRNVLPWADVDWTKAQAACQNLGARLCSAEEWLRACGGPQAQNYPYGNNYSASRCNGGGYDTDGATAGVQDEVLPTRTANQCVRDGVFDLSGNLKEWVQDGNGQLRMVRGGGYETNPAAGLECSQANDLKNRVFRHPTIGFRCCR